MGKGRGNPKSVCVPHEHSPGDVPGHRGFALPGGSPVPQVVGQGNMAHSLWPGQGVLATGLYLDHYISCHISKEGRKHTGKQNRRMARREGARNQPDNSHLRLGLFLTIFHSICSLKHCLSGSDDLGSRVKIGFLSNPGTVQGTPQH